MAHVCPPGVSQLVASLSSLSLQGQEGGQDEAAASALDALPLYKAVSEAIGEYMNNWRTS